MGWPASGCSLGRDGIPIRERSHLGSSTGQSRCSAASRQRAGSPHGVSLAEQNAGYAPLCRPPGDPLPSERISPARRSSIIPGEAAPERSAPC